ncbi:leucine-rich repeat protein [Atopobacter phocae]|uniref:leucine-rich repeat protein n=1 Tax=Atopobacter phocae TaxID=136492 RepID=UPI0004725330|nr:leucine-rich repeat protein [Atopobacter phocae]
MLNKPKTILSIASSMLVLTAMPVATNSHIVFADTPSATSVAKIGDTFTHEGITYKVLSIDQNKHAGTIQIGDGSQPITSSEKYINIPSTIIHNDITFQVTTVGEKAFAAFEGEDGATTSTVQPTRVTLPTSITTIKKEAFMGSKMLKDVVFETPESSKLTKIEDKAFQYSSIKKISLPKSLEYIGTRAFDFSELEDITIPKASKLEVISHNAFASTEHLDHITLPKSLNKLGEDVFKYSFVKQIDVEAGNQKYKSDKGVLYNHDQTVLIKYPVFKNEQTYTAPATLKEIKDDAFSTTKGSIYLHEIKLNDGLEKIGAFAFRGLTNLNHLELPQTLKSIGKLAFYDNHTLEELTIPDSVTDVSEYTLYNVPKLQKLSIGKGIETIPSNFVGGTAKPTELKEIDLQHPSVQLKKDSFDLGEQPATQFIVHSDQVKQALKAIQIADPNIQLKETPNNTDTQTYPTPHGDETKDESSNDHTNGETPDTSKPSVDQPSAETPTDQTDDNEKTQPGANDSTKNHVIPQPKEPEHETESTDPNQSDKDDSTVAPHSEKETDKKEEPNTKEENPSSDKKDSDLPEKESEPSSEEKDSSALDKKDETTQASDSVKPLVQPSQPAESIKPSTDTSELSQPKQPQIKQEKEVKPVEQSKASQPATNHSTHRQAALPQTGETTSLGIASSLLTMGIGLVTYLITRAISFSKKY